LSSEQPSFFPKADWQTSQEKQPFFIVRYLK